MRHADTAMFLWRKRRHSSKYVQDYQAEVSAKEKARDEERATERTVREQQKARDKARIQMIETKLALGYMLCKNQRFQEAEEELRQAVEKQKQMYGTGCKETIDSKLWIARVLCLQRKYKDCEELLRRLLEDQEQEYNKEDTGITTAKRFLVFVLYAQDQYGEAETMLCELQRKYEKNVGENYTEMISVKHWLGCTLYQSRSAHGFDEGTNVSVEELCQYSLSCLYCRILFDTIGRFYPGWTEAGRDMKFVEINSVKLSPCSQPYIQLRIRGSDVSRAEFNSIEVRIDTDDGYTWKPDPRGALSMLQWKEPEYWLRQCVDSHAVCRIPSPQFIPRRLLHVTDDERGLHLVESTSLQQDSKAYCALSYCWGSPSDTLTTRKENLDQHLEGFSLSTLPQTIHDAVIVCRSLSIPYLWVDALCIVQNDDGERDWYEQSSEMCEIYSNAHLVISVDAAPSANFGFLPGRDHSQKQWESIRLSDTTSGRRLIASVRAHKFNTSISYDGRSWDGISVKPLLSRGWALQESMLANRLLRFTTNGMRWECNHIHQDQMGLMSRVIRLSKLIRLYPNVKSGLPQNELQALYAEEELHTRHITDFMKQNTHDTIYHAWQGIVSHYSERDLTKITDKLSALSGLARFVSEALGTGSEDYLAGHWRGDLASSLLWYVGPSKNPVSTVTYRAPTWSWASIDGKIQYFYEQYQFQLKSDLIINSATCYTSLIDRFGRVTSGKLCVTGLTVPVSLYISPTMSHPVQYFGGNGRAAHAHINQYSWVTSDQQSEDRMDCIYYEVLLDRRMLVEYLTSRNFKCLLVGSHYDTFTGGSRVWWLVLRQSLATQDCWERVGIGYFQEYLKTLELFRHNSATQETITLI